MTTIAPTSASTKILTQTVIEVDSASQVEEHTPHATLVLDDRGEGTSAICIGNGQAVINADDIDALLTVLNRAKEIRDSLRSGV